MAGTATCRRGPDGRITLVRDRLPRHKAESLHATGLEIEDSLHGVLAKDPQQWTLGTKAGGENTTNYMNRVMPVLPDGWLRAT